MSTSWEYAKWAQKVHEHGGPAAYDKARLQAGYNAGYADGKAEGQRNGMLAMLPFVVGCGYLIVEKWPDLSFKFKCWKQQIERRKLLKEENSSKGKHLNLEPICAHCGKKASGLDEVIKLFGFDRAEDGKLTRREICKECWDKINEE